MLNEYSLSWISPDQESFQVLVASDKLKLAADVGDLWDSGRRISNGSSQIICRGKALPSSATVWWKVRTWNRSGEGGRWSAPAEIDVPQAAQTTQPVPRPSALAGEARFIPGKIGRAIELVDRATIRVADYGDLRSTDGTTMAAWIRSEHATDQWQCLYRKEDGARRLLAIGKEGPFWGLWCGLVIGGDYVEFGAPIDRAELIDGSWHHVAASFDGEMIRLFVDGEQIGEQAHSGKLNLGDNTPAHIGSHGGNSEWFQGGIDDLRIYKRGLGEKAIGALAEGKVDVDPEALAAHWKFDGDIQNQATYSSTALRNRIVLLGGSLIYEMEKGGHFETAVTARWPHHDITFRNLGWPGDDVFGTARSEFGSAQNTRSWKPPGAVVGFGASKRAEQVRAAKPTTLIVGYGAEAAWADTDKKMSDFQAGYLLLVDELEATGARLILLTPIPHRGSTGALPEPTDQNQRLAGAAKFILQTAVERGHQAFDLFNLDRDGSDYRSPIHLSASGQREFGLYLADALGVPASTNNLRLVPTSDRGFAVAIAGKSSDPLQTKRGLRWTSELDQLPVLGGGFITVPWEGDHPPFRLRIDGAVSNLQATGLSGSIESSPDLDQVEQLRRTICEKNQFHRYRLRPINSSYIFLFRRHEMGHLAYEMEDFDELIAGHEHVIANLAIPRAHAYEIERVEPWKSPRDYPDHEVPKDIPEPNLEEELAAFSVADGFRVNLFASDPMIANPINLNWDVRGRAWVSTSSTYPHIKPGNIPNDRIVILEDTDGDGVADKHTLFAEGLTVPHSVMPVAGGAYVCSTTDLIFLEDSDGDDVADSQRVIYSGFGNADVHHMIHGLRWAPWGDLYFTQSIYINSFVDTPHGPRRMNGSGIWRFRPEIESLDAFAVGMVNPWGFALDEWGQSFGTDGAGGSGPHHVFPGAAFRSAVGAHRVLDGLIPGKPKNTAAEFASGRHLPAHWQGSLLANDFRANRTVRYELQERDSGFTAEEVETVLRSSHRSFRPVDIKMGPDGAVYVVDWYNPIIDHGEVDFHHPARDKSHGRIWRITADDRPLVERPRIAGEEVGELLEMLRSPEQYTRTQANRELASRQWQDLQAPLDDWLSGLDRDDTEFEHHRLEGLWLQQAQRAGSAPLLQTILKSPSPQARAAAVRAVSNWDSRTSQIDQIEWLATAIGDGHPRVRLEAVCALLKLGTLEAANIALRALDQPTDDNLDFALELTVRALRDQWLPAMQAGKPVFDGVPSRLAYALNEVGDPRAIASLVEVVKQGGLPADDLPGAVTTIAALGEPAELETVLNLAMAKPELLRAIADGATKNPNVPAPPKASGVATFLKSGNLTTRIAAVKLIGHWRVAKARSLLLQLAENSLGDELMAVCQALASLEDFDTLREFSAPGRPLPLRAAATAAWAKVAPRAATEAAVSLLRSPQSVEYAGLVIGAFLTHGDGPEALAEALAEVQLAEPVAIAGLRLANGSGLQIPVLVAALTTAGKLKTLSFDLSPREREEILEQAVSHGDTSRGQEVFNRAELACKACHVIENQGGKLGPDLTTVGSYMTAESLLDSLLNPSSSIKQGYETAIITKRDNTVISGLLQRRAENATLIRDPSDQVVSIPNSEIAKIDTSPVSLMPPGLTAQLRRDELADLMKYLISLGKQDTTRPTE